MILDGIEIGEAELRAMQKEFPDGAVAGILDRVLGAMTARWAEAVQSLTAGIDQVRQAQGALYVLDEIDQRIRHMVQFDMEKWKDGEEAKDKEDNGEEEDEDVRFG